MTRDASVENFAALLMTHTGRRPHLLSGRQVDMADGCQLLWEYRDITDVKRTQAHADMLSMVVEQSPLSLVITDLTADAYAKDSQRCLAGGMDDFLAKPVVMQQLTPILARWLA